MLNIKVKGQCVEAKLEGGAEQLIQELVMLNTAVINRIVDSVKLKADKTPLMAKLQMADTVHACVLNSIKIGINHKETANDITKEKLGLDMEEVQLQVMMMEYLLDKWVPIMNHHKLSNVEMTVMKREVKEAGLTMDEFLDAAIYKQAQIKKEEK